MGRRILLVDDEFLIIEMLAEVLSDNGYSVITALDGQKALKEYQICQGAFDLIITDVKMPEMNGVELVDELCLMGNHVPIIMITAHRPFLSERINIFEAEGIVKAVIEKPLNLNMFLNIVKLNMED